MKLIYKLIITFPLGVLLFGCSAKPEYHHAVYYESHITEAQQVVDYCKKQDKNLGKAIQANQNCRNAYYAIEESKMMQQFKSMQK